MDSKRILQLLARWMGKAASEKELAELKELLAKYPERRFLIEILQHIEEEKNHVEPAISENELLQESWDLLQRELMQAKEDNAVLVQSRKSLEINGVFASRWGRRAAVWLGVILLAGGSFFIWKHKRPQRADRTAFQMKQISLPYGAPEKVILPDSSVVWLNAGSHIRYAENFVQSTRTVYLQGEAYFNISHDATHPFVVHAGNIEIKVLGTEFNVQAYANENKIETTLLDGKVQVQIAGNPDKKIILTPREKLTVVNQEFEITGVNSKKQKEMSFQVKEIVPDTNLMDLTPEIAWMKDELAFQDEQFGNLAKRLERRYNVHIFFRDTALEDERLTGVFGNENIQKALKILQMTTPFSYRISNDTVYMIRSEAGKR